METCEALNIMHPPGPALFLALILTTTPMASLSAQADDIVFSDISGDPDNPRRHLRVENPADLNARRRRSDLHRAAARHVWPAYRPQRNSRSVRFPPTGRATTPAPYRSATHGPAFRQQLCQYNSTGLRPVRRSWCFFPWGRSLPRTVSPSPVTASCSLAPCS